MRKIELDCIQTMLRESIIGLERPGETSALQTSTHTKPAVCNTCTRPVRVYGLVVFELLTQARHTSVLAWGSRSVSVLDVFKVRCDDLGVSVLLVVAVTFWNFYLGHNGSGRGGFVSVV